MIEVYDTYAQTSDGNLIHFDVLVKPGMSKNQINQFAEEYIQSISQATDITLKIARCNYCHSAPGNEEIDQAIESHGHYILPLEGCPK